ncbi:MAG TPA: nitroreductase/quinone reductase family protein [Acidimicrobiia bacterium]|jgi:deazaflavin-dependent oxidoreductase (nitroreductase family)|nr:nitroreductase/quinone reductase family protein [Acidimicrobiia bacterium]
MSDSVTADVQLPQDIPPNWANSMMKWALTTPGLQGMVGQGVALLTFTGRKTGKTYTIPVSYHRDGDVVTVVTKRARNWWRNFSAPHEVQVRLAGRTYNGQGVAGGSDEETLEFMTRYLEERPIDAKAYGLKKDEVTRDKIARILPHIVVIRIEIAPIE